MSRAVRVSLAAREDLAESGEWIADQADAETASAYVRRITRRFSFLSDFSNGGTPRPE